MDTYKLQVLKSRIKVLALEGANLSKEIRMTLTHEGKKRDALWCQKRALGQETRAMLLAYGLLKGKPFSRMERRFAPNNRPNLRKVEELLTEYANTPESLYAAKWQLKVHPFVSTAVTYQPKTILPPPSPSWFTRTWNRIRELLGF